MPYAPFPSGQILFNETLVNIVGVCLDQENILYSVKQDSVQDAIITILYADTLYVSDPNNNNQVLFTFESTNAKRLFVLLQ